MVYTVPSKKELEDMLKDTKIIKIKGYINVPKGGFKLYSTILYFNLKEAESCAIDKSRIKEIEFEIEVDDDK